MGRYVVDLEELDRSDVAIAGGKAAHLGELMRIPGIRVPDGFCVTTDAFRRAGAGSSPASAMPDEVAEAITASLARLGEEHAYAVRSSATAEDSATVSFAGQQDSFLGVVGRAAVLEHVRRCWASLSTDRAVAYREQHGIDAAEVDMAVVVQRMVDARAAGVLFTADPVSGHRKVAIIEATIGLGDALVSGTVDPDRYEVRGEAVHVGALAGGVPVLTEEQVVELVRLGRRIEAHLDSPQDIEWCLDDDGFAVVQTRPITTLFPVPHTDDDESHVYLSVGHQQMMTDAMRPLGLSFWQLTAARPMTEAGGRLFVDVSAQLASAAGRAGLLAMAGRSDALVGDALRTIIERGDLAAPAPEDAPPVGPPGGAPATVLETDPAVVAGLMDRASASLAALERDIEDVSGEALLELILADIEELKRVLFDPLGMQVIMAGIAASWELNDRLEEWLGERNVADTLAQSAPDNVTSEMGLALLDLADVVRDHPDVVAHLREVETDRAGDDLLEGLADREGGEEARAAIQAFLDRYGMRCVGEIDISRPRWAERPVALVPVLLANVIAFEPGEGRRRFEQGLREAEGKRREVLERLRGLPDGNAKAEEVDRMIDRLRTFIGYREYPKYHWMGRYFLYRRALVREADRLVEAAVLRTPDDVWSLTLPELRDVVATQQADHDLIRQREEAFRWHRTLTPPRVLASDGEAIDGAYRRDDVPAGALIGLGVSAGTVEGRARVVRHMEEADLGPGDILVTTFTDPSWTPVFVAIAGLVTEVGGLMTHGAVVAREYGLPAVVAVQDATRRIRDGQRIRVHGAEGYVELLSQEDAS